MEEEIKSGENREEKQTSDKPLEDMTVKELREIAKKIPGVTGYSSMKKDELLAVIEKSREVEEDVKEKKPIDRMTAKELREIAKEIPGVTGVTAMKKEELVDIIKKDRGIKDEKPKKKIKKKIEKPTLSIKELKEKVVHLRKAREASRGAKDRKKADILCRRINRLKKQTRKVARG